MGTASIFVNVPYLYCCLGSRYAPLETYQKLSEDEKNDISRVGADWILLLQFASIQEDDYELMFGDVGNLYFYIRKQDLAERNFDKIWLVLQCG